ncbi:L-ascorbate metabolism protein UlaG, beta-lactamase superfamily [Pseudonocardia ammonioxydans]|uniref:L-ascorbate metabolism protein UlaG, beta-lactamase superfamily n=1 Tax=Pseudonocardia ammonioxydans TaxID=260086 RepID=A0A1I4W1Z1_PSUAM|nr:MBL fold metallo-hydrolase [Pseudonocardia ammonioxydans]SFN07578.1 L-ascorbate metabolism protein UlaG, beta-lactamase superfamily [Pseudonocardia ammonioxydans]
MDLPETTFLGHSTLRLRMGGRTVLTDPVLTAAIGPLRRVVGAVDPAELAAVDLVLISHLHADHLHLASLRRLPRDAEVVVPAGAGEWLRRHGVPRVSELRAGQRRTFGGLGVTGTPADHSGHRWGPRLTHGPQAEAMGHLLEADGLRVYLAGDTGLFPGLDDVAGQGPIDLAALPVWGWGPNLGPGHLDPAAAAEAVRRLAPRVALPVHWGTLAVAGLRSVPRVGGRMRELLVRPPHDFADAVTAAGHGTRTLVLPPGAAAGAVAS